MNTQTFGPIFAPYAAANDVILILPQANGSWEYSGTIGSDPATASEQFTRDGRVMQFMRALVTRATTTKAATFTDLLADGVHTYGEGQPGMATETDGKGGAEAKDAWVYDETTGAWSNTETGEAYDWGSKDQDPKAGKGDWNKEDWADWDKDASKDTATKEEKDGAKALAASVMAVAAAAMSMF
jgi:hypothetical protein